MLRFTVSTAPKKKKTPEENNVLMKTDSFCLNGINICNNSPDGRRTAIKNDSKTILQNLRHVNRNKARGLIACSGQRVSAVRWWRGREGKKNKVWVPTALLSLGWSTETQIYCISPQTDSSDASRHHRGVKSPVSRFGVRESPFYPAFCRSFWSLFLRHSFAPTGWLTGSFSRLPPVP